MSLELEDQYEKIYRYCYFKVKNREIAEDLTQETFLKFYAQKTYKDKNKKTAYMYVIARNLIIDYYRKNQCLSLQNDIKVEKTDDFITSFTVKEALNYLSAEEKEILLFRYANDMKIGEIAQVLSISRFAVSRRIKKAKDRLKKLLEEEGLDEVQFQK